MNKDIQKHIESKCATYAGDGCCLLDRQCPFFNTENEGARCIYYENAVLPEDEQLKGRYWSRFGLAYWSGKDAKVCAECSKAFEPKSNAQKYCDSCRSIIQQRQKSAQNRRYYRRKKDD